MRDSHGAEEASKPVAGDWIAALTMLLRSESRRAMAYPNLADSGDSMKQKRYLIVGLLMLQMNTPFAADSKVATWVGTLKTASGDATYQVVLTKHRAKVFGTWRVDSFRSSGGCLKGQSSGKAIYFASCTTDGSASARDSASVCPTFESKDNSNRFTAKGPDLDWEYRDDKGMWRSIVRLKRAESDEPFSWGSDCGSKD